MPSTRELSTETLDDHAYSTTRAGFNCSGHARFEYDNGHAGMAIWRSGIAGLSTIYWYTRRQVDKQVYIFFPKKAGNMVTTRKATITRRSTWVSLAICLFVPFYTITEIHRLATKDIQRTANRQIHPACTELLHSTKVFEALASSSIGNRLTTPLSQLLDQLFIDTALQTLIVCRMDEEFRAEPF